MDFLSSMHNAYLYWQNDISSFVCNVYLFWFVVGSIFFIIEILAPVAIFLWLGVSAYIIAFLAFLYPLPPSYAAILFAVISPIIMHAGPRFFKAKHKQGPDSDLNQKSNQLIGRIFALSQDIQNGRGQMKVGDSVWPVKGEDMPAGTMVQVTDIDGITLCVEKVVHND